MTRGFVTMATGNDNYYRIARNLLRSYRYFSANPMPFSLICDRKGPLTEAFDDVIILNEPTYSYLDKLKLPEYVPYDETIFVDADCLAYRDLNDFWEAFEGGTDFSVFGTDYPTDWPWAWFKCADVGEFASQIQTIPDFIGGVYFFRKSEQLITFSETCNYILDNYQRFRFRQFSEPADEPVFALAMAIHGYATAGEKSLPVCFYPHALYFETDIQKGYICYNSRYTLEKGLQADAYLIHWGSGNTRKPKYLLEEYKLRKMAEGILLGKAQVSLAKVRIVMRYLFKAVLRRVGLRKLSEYIQDGFYS